MDSSAIATSPADSTRTGAPQFRKFLVVSAVLALVFAWPLWHLVQFSFRNDLYSFTILVPFITGYLLWTEKEKLSAGGSALPRLFGVALAILAIAFAGGAIVLGGSRMFSQNGLALWMYSLISAVGAAALLILGRKTLAVMAFPLTFLFFLAPFPVALEHAIEAVLQHGSSWTAHTMFELSGMPVYREGTLFQLPGFRMQVAPECSGIRSTLALFLTSLVAGHLFLRSPWKRAALALFVGPLALVRNGFRVFVIGELCVKISPDMIDSWIHRHGGPAFFALSLIPFSIVLYFLYRSENRRRAASTQS